MKALLFVSSLCVFSLCGCQKWRRSNWITAKITVLDFYTHEPIDAEVRLISYFSYYGGTLEEKQVYFDKTGSDGMLEFERKLERKENPKQLEIRASGYMVPGWQLFPATVLPANVGSKNEHELLLKGYYQFKVHLKNNNCFDATDSVFVKIGEWPTRVLTGCQDNLYFWSEFYLREPNPTFTITSKKNGMIETTYHQASLSLGTTNTVYINY